MKVFAIVAIELKRFTRDRFNIFFVLIFPLAIVLLIGLQYGEPPTPEVGLVSGDGPLATEIADRLDGSDRIELTRYDESDELIGAVDDGDLAAGVVIPIDLDDRVAAGGPTIIGFVSSPLGLGPQLQAIVDDAVNRTLAVPTAVAAAVDLGADPGSAEQTAQDLASITELISVATSTTGDRLFPEDLSGYDIGAAGQLVLFMFLTSLTGSATMIQNRRLGISSRMMSTPTSLRTLIAGEAAARFAIALTQGAYIMVATVALFGVNWGNLVAAIAILAAFGAVGASAAMLAGATFKNDEQAGGVSVVVALGLAALGGSMLPIELFSDTMVTIAQGIPHFWALDAFAEVVRHDGTVADITTQLGILLSFAAAIGVVAVWRLRATLTRP